MQKPALYWNVMHQVYLKVVLNFFSSYRLCTWRLFGSDAAIVVAAAAVAANTCARWLYGFQTYRFSSPTHLVERKKIINK